MQAGPNTSLARTDAARVEVEAILAAAIGVAAERQKSSVKEHKKHKQLFVTVGIFPLPTTI